MQGEVTDLTLVVTSLNSHFISPNQRPHVLLKQHLEAHLFKQMGNELANFNAVQT